MHQKSSVNRMILSAFNSSMHSVYHSWISFFRCPYVFCFDPWPDAEWINWRQLSVLSEFKKITISAKRVYEDLKFGSFMKPISFLFLFISSTNSFLARSRNSAQLNDSFLTKLNISLECIPVRNDFGNAFLWEMISEMHSCEKWFRKCNRAWNDFKLTITDQDRNLFSICSWCWLFHHETMMLQDLLHPLH